MKLNSSSNDRYVGECIPAYDDRILNLEARLTGPLEFQPSASVQPSEHLPLFKPPDQLTLDKYLNVKNTQKSQVCSPL